MIEDSKMLDIRTELEKHMDGIAQDLKDHLEHEDIVDYKNWGFKGGEKPRLSEAGMDSPLTESLNTSLSKFLLMAVTDGASVTETPRLKRGSMWYASAPFNSPIRGHHGSISVLGVGATLSACGALPSTRSSRARWGYEAGSPVRKGGVAHLEDNAIDVQLYVDLPSKEPVGFDIGIVIGGPNIRLIYSRGACKLQGAWGSLTDEKDVDSEICETILDYLAQG